jgi:aquaporin Z
VDEGDPAVGARKICGGAAWHQEAGCDHAARQDDTLDSSRHLYLTSPLGGPITGRLVGPEPPHTDLANLYEKGTPRQVLNLSRWGGLRARYRLRIVDPVGNPSTDRPDSTDESAQRVRHRLALEFGSRQEWDDPALEWRRLFSESFGTFLLVFVAAGGGLLHAQGQISLASAVVAPGLMVMAIILFMGAVSGAHLNPAVSLAFAMRGDFPWVRVPGYIIVQLVGATLAALFLLAVFGDVGHLGATLPGPGYANWQALLMEIALTAGLVSVILGTASAAQNVGAIAALGVGGYIALAGLWAAPVSGVSMNPARSFGPALVDGDFSSYWIYLVGPLAGALIAVGFAWILRGPGGDPVARAAGSGVLSSLEEKMKARRRRRR